MSAPFSHNFYFRLLIGIVILGLYTKSVHDFMKIMKIITPHHLWLAAGNNTGESYIISKAIAQVVKDKSDLDLEVCLTKGTEQNLDLLQTGEVQLATAQADYATENIGMLNQADYPVETKDTNSKDKMCPKESLKHLPKDLQKPKTIAVLYKDFFHLFVKNTKIEKFAQLINKAQPKYRVGYQHKITVNVPKNGGQLWSFTKILEHYYKIKINAKDTDKYFYIDESVISDKNPCPQKADVVFRVRALDNQDINNLVQHNCGKLLSIEQAAAMKVKHPAFNPDNIPTGIYKAADPPVPKEAEKGLYTVAVSRLLLAGEKVDKAPIEKITQIIFENRQYIVNAIDKIEQYDGKKGDYQYIKPLIESISYPPSNTENKEIFIPIHPGAIAFYNQDNNLWKKLNDNGNALNLFVALVAASPVCCALILWWWQRPQKIEVDKYINQANELIKSKSDADFMQHELDTIFNQVVEALSVNKISQESFRTFNEAYKATRETIERKRQFEQQTEANKRKNEADEYINAAIKLMNKDEGDLESRQKQLDEEFNKAALALINGKISQSLFRTFNEAYKTTREAIEQERQQAMQKKAQAQRKMAESYVAAVVEVLRDERQSKYLLHEKLDNILQEVVTKLTEQKISEESFRTFMEAYKTTRDAIERRKS